MAMATSPRLPPRSGISYTFPSTNSKRLPFVGRRSKSSAVKSSFKVLTAQPRRVGTISRYASMVRSKSSSVCTADG